YAHLGASARAQRCYQRANLPASQVRARADQMLVFSNGRVTGRLLRNGAAVAGARVGLIGIRAIAMAVQMRGEEPGLTNPFAPSSPPSNGIPSLGAATTSALPTESCTSPFLPPIPHSSRPSSLPHSVFVAVFQRRGWRRIRCCESVLCGSSAEPSESTYRRR